MSEADERDGLRLAAVAVRDMPKIKAYRPPNWPEQITYPADGADPTRRVLQVSNTVRANAYKLDRLRGDPRRTRTSPLFRAARALGDTIRDRRLRP